MAEKIQAMIDATESDRVYFAELRDRVASQHDRERYGVDALACAIRLKALRQCLGIVRGP